MKIECKVCKKWFKPLGYARHRAMHYDETERQRTKKAQEAKE